jgi:hypothetical protein
MGRGRGASARIALLVALVGVLDAGDALAKPLRFELRVTPTSGTLSDTFVATVHIETAGLDGADNYWLPTMNQFAVADTRLTRTRSIQVDPIKGRQPMTVETRVYILRPTRAGRLTIGPAEIELKGKRYKTKVIPVEVRDPGGGTTTPATPVPPSSMDPTARGGVGAPGFEPPNPKGRGDMFLHAVADKKEVYVGEQVVVSWLLYTKTENVKLEPRPPRLSGLWAETLYDAALCCRYFRDRVGGQSYLVAIVEKRAVFPTRPGVVEISPYAADLTDLRPRSRRRFRASSPTLELQVKPLPPGAPKGFDPTYVGEFSAEASVDRDHIDAGQATTLTLVVKGKGAVRRTTAPTLDLAGFRFRAPRDFTEKIESEGNLVKGERSYRYWATPSKGGRQLIPPIRIPYFNPSTGRYEVAQTKPIAIFVKGNPNATAGAALSGNQNLIARDIRLLREGTTISSRTTPSLYTRGWFWLLALLPLVGFVGLVISDVVRGRMSRDEAGTRMRRARSRARKALRYAEHHLKMNKPDELYAELAGVIYQHIEDRTGEPVRAMTNPELRGFMIERGFDEGVVSRTMSELENCDFARFASSGAGPGEMSAALGRTRELLKEIAGTRLVGEEESEGDA